MTDPELMRIGDLAELTGKTVRALHLYEERGLLSPAARSQGGFRLYDAENVRRIRYIDGLQRIGYKLEEIGGLLGDWVAGSSPRGAMARIEAAYQQRLAEVRASIQELKALEVELEESLGFLAGCRPCDRAGEPAATCCTCKRAAATDAELMLIRGLTGR
ncbi:MAG: MerR family transcriptional regulator [Myxococcales bacterium]|nr:MerR family transcriptional regulator [Myxococcales bacterium]